MKLNLGVACCSCGNERMKVTNVVVDSFAEYYYKCLKCENIIVIKLSLGFNS